MKYTFPILTVSIFLIGAVLCWGDKTGWGWWVFAGFIALDYTNKGDE